MRVSYLDDLLEVVVAHAGLDLRELVGLGLLLLLLQGHVGLHAHGHAVPVLQQKGLDRLLEHAPAGRQVSLDRTKIES